MTVDQMTKKDFESIPLRENWQQEIECSSFIILPTRRKHDSGYLIMDIIAVKDNEPLFRCNETCDVVHLDGIGGYGYKWLDRYRAVPQSIPPSGWNIDCLPKSGLLRLWPSSGRILIGSGLSSQEVYALSKEGSK